MTIKKNDIVAGAIITVTNGKATKKINAPILEYRMPFTIWTNRNMANTMEPNDGEKFEIILSPGRKSPVYSYPEISSKYVSIRSLSDNQVYETFYVNVRYDASL